MVVDGCGRRVNCRSRGGAEILDDDPERCKRRRAGTKSTVTKPSARVANDPGPTPISAPAVSAPTTVAITRSQWATAATLGDRDGAQTERCNRRAAACPTNAFPPLSLSRVRDRHWPGRDHITKFHI